jgi:hypothetical protein
MSLNVENYQNFLKNRFHDKYEELNQAIINSEALIAGSSVLFQYQNFINSDNIDLDTYVHVSKAKTLVDYLINELDYEIGFSNYITPEYDKSFFKKNHILARFRLVNNASRLNRPPFDIMIINDEYSLTDIVSNFDLSICEIWYDGREVHATDIEGINNRVATLKQDYVNSLLTFNKFTINRIKKYEERDFKIEYSIPESVTMPIRIDKKIEKTISTPEEWVTLKMYKLIVFPGSTSIFDNFNSAFLESLNLENIYLAEYIKKERISFNVVVSYPLLAYNMESLTNVVNQLLGITEFSENDKKRIRKQFYIELLKETEYPFFPSKYKKYLRDYLYITESSMSQYFSEHYGESPMEPSSEDLRFERENRGSEEETETNAIQEFMNRRERNMNRRQEITTRNRERERQERRERRERRENERRESERRDRREILDRERDRELLINDLEHNLQYDRDNELLRTTLENRDTYTNERLEEVLKDYYKSLINNYLPEESRNTGILEYGGYKTLKILLKNHYQVNYLLNRIDEIIEELRLNNPHGIDISFYENIYNHPENYPIRELKQYITAYYNENIRNLELGPEDEEELTQPMEFEGINFDESRLGNTCQDLIMFDEKDITEHLREEGAIILINRGPGNDSEILCFDRETLQSFYDNKEDGWFYACLGDLFWNKLRNNQFEIEVISNDRRVSDENGNIQIYKKPYVKIPINMEGMNAFISARELYSMIHSDRNVFYIEPKLDRNGTQISLTHTITWKNVYGEANWVSANHCQSGSNILVYEIKVCNNPESCIRSIFGN